MGWVMEVKHLEVGQTEKPRMRIVTLSSDFVFWGLAAVVVDDSSHPPGVVRRLPSAHR